MGDALKESKPKACLVVRADAHIDEAWTSHGFVSKSDSLSVSASDAKLLLAAHPYLTKMGD